MEIQWKTIGLIITIMVIGGLSLISIISFLIPASRSTITLATTTSTDNSGLLDYLHPEMTKDTGVTVDIVPVGTGAAIEHAKIGLADVIIVHARVLEDQFVAEGYGIHRVDLMYNDFLIVGPSEDPANIKGLKNSTEIFIRLYNARESIKFASRGDNSGTHIKELELWTLANISIQSDSFEWAQNNPWYLETGSGMGDTLTRASTAQAYTLTDRGTWLFNEESLNLELLAQGSEFWHNPYGAILVNPDKFNPNKIKFEMAKKYVQWLISTKGQTMIDNYTIKGKQAFFADFINHVEELSTEELEFWNIENTSNLTYRYKKTAKSYSLDHY
ncbi:MAG: substrate-binding domain-containing protein [Candidatus Hodarchaeota archaeon]